jgi:ATP-dependent DNA helicase RecQ
MTIDQVETETQYLDEVSQKLLSAMKQYWGYDSFRPQQEQAMRAVLSDTDSVVVLPTGGGKSLCFQVPAVCRDGLAVVVSPLISLMKDQVDALTDCGVAAAFVNSSLSYEEKKDVVARVKSGEIRLLYVAPERLVLPRTIDFLREAGVSFIAIDEAHCISQWGHDFRPEYRSLSMLRDEFPNVAIHAFTATATEDVRNDIAAQLQFDEHEILVGSFDRLNLTYKVERRKKDRLAQICEVIDRHKYESGIVYCISRKEVEAISSQLNNLGYSSRPYHAGLSADERKSAQDDFIKENVETIVATVAFGMGIDKSNVRYVIHSGMPKSLENYQQEAGRAGRDGLEADCCLFYSMADYVTWQRIIEMNEAANAESAVASLQQMANYCTGVVCRHKSLVEHFGEPFHRDNCGACDVCSGDLEMIDEPLVVGQKILSSVVRTGQRFGGEYNALVLKGSTDRRIINNRHDELSTYGLLSDFPQRAIRDWIEQLAGQGFLVRQGEYNTLKVSQTGRRLLKGELAPKLLKPQVKSDRAERRSGPVEDSWENVDRALFDSLRQLRRDKANERGVPPYIIFSDAALRDMARRKPRTLDEFREVKGVGDKKLKDYGEDFIAEIEGYLE